jgi:endonuclease/exonuclease/phosphatase family metal-dependent hydrolase
MIIFQNFQLCLLLVGTNAFTPLKKHHHLHPNSRSSSASGSSRRDILSCSSTAAAAAAIEDAPSTTASSRSGTSSSSSSSSDIVVLPGQSFRETSVGELSVVSFNMLAPFYHSLGVDDWQERERFATQDRLTRVPLAVQMAQQANADILCLQEVEGGPEHEPMLKELLAKSYDCVDGSTTTSTPGYDSMLWSPLLPNREGDVVGLCIAWRSQKHRLVASDCYKRGMMGQFAETIDADSGTTTTTADGGASASATTGMFAIANVHLPARPSNVMGRLIAMSRTVQKLAAYDPPRRGASPLDGLLVVAGDFNCDQNSVTARLLTTGRSPFGNVRDRNYKANISKVSASKMTHAYRFQDVYDAEEDLRKDYASVTVSLSGRGPGCMDHLFFAQMAKAPPKQQAKPKPINKNERPTAKRRARRTKASRMRARDVGGPNNHISTAVRIESVLATVFKNGTDEDALVKNTQRLETINSGLPNVPAGFPSDHIPIGALFVANPDFQKSAEEDTKSPEEEEKDSINGDAPARQQQQDRSGGVSQTVKRRRENGLQSMSIRRRHNTVLRYVADWLQSRGAQDMVRDQPLYKNPFCQGVDGLKQKSRAPDLMCRLGKDEDSPNNSSSSTLVLIEVTVTAQPDAVRTQKLQKYSDLPALLLSSPAVMKAGLQVVETPLVLVLDELGRIPDETRHDIEVLAALMTDTPEDAKQEAQRFCNRLQAMFTELG